ncbi:NAD(P)H-hydrate dehydratase [Candidatus Sumerlaeota bacterium]|nr:NAD(P)H-hydrate dehydratase [Candidatus Sumerlaeota bacterium]
MKVVTAEEMRRIDRITIEERGVPSLQLMEKAGRAVAELTIKEFSPWNVAIITGKGNNAGDGFVAARYLWERDVTVFLYMLAGRDELKGDALTNYERLPEDINQIRIDESNVSRLAEELKNDDCIIDALLGTGIKGEVTGLFARVIEAINNSKRPVVAVDIPSGLYADDTYFEGKCVDAHLTITMGLPKLGMVIHPGVAYCGRMRVAPLDFPDELLNSHQWKHNLLLAKEVRSFFPERPANSNKKTFGYVLICAGSPGMTGAAILSAKSATRSGAGLIYVAVPQNCLHPIEAQLIDPVKIPVPDVDAGYFTPASFDALKELLPRIDAVAIGPGISQHPETKKFVHLLLEKITDKPIVIDADGLNALAGETERIKKHKSPLILTPHPGQMARLLGGDATPEYVQRNRIKIARQFATEHNVVLVLKGYRTVVAAPDGEIWINPTGNTGLAKGGSGDILTGLIVGFLAQKIEPIKAALIGVYIHGFSAEVAAKRLTERAMTPEDVVNLLPQTFFSLVNYDDDPRLSPK